MRVLVCGGRHYSDRARLFAVLDEFRRVNTVDALIHGGASGADSLASEWAKQRGIEVAAFPADWAYGPAAGPMRNAKMLREGKPDIVIAFPGDKGTRNMKMQARLAGVRVMEIP